MKNALIVIFSLFCYCANAQSPQDLTQADLDHFVDENTDITILYSIVKDFSDNPEQYNPAFTINDQILEAISDDDFAPDEKLDFYLRKYFTEPADRPINEQAVLTRL
jgi:hypothetical protein